MSTYGLDPLLGELVKVGGTFLLFDEQSSDPATPSAGEVEIYAKTDKKIYRRGSDGIVVELGGGSSGGGRTFAFFAG